MRQICKFEYKVDKDSLYCREIMRKNKTPTQMELFQKVTWQPPSNKDAHQEGYKGDIPKQ